MARLVVQSKLLTALPSPACTTAVRYSKPIKHFPEFDKPVWQHKNLPDRETPQGQEFEENEFLPRRITYWPPDLKQNRPRAPLHVRKPWLKIKNYITLETVDEPVKPEYTDTPQYPPIKSFEVGNVRGEERIKRLEWYEKIRSLPTFEQKLAEIVDTDRRPTVMLKGYMWLYDQLNVQQNVTKTNLIDGLPPLYDSMDVSSLTKTVTPHIVDAVLVGYNECPERRVGRWRSSEIPKAMRDEMCRGRSLLLDIMNIAMKACVETATHLTSSHVDLMPTTHSWWYGGGYELPSSVPHITVHRYKESNQPFQFMDEGLMHIRSSKYLPPVVDVSLDEVCHSPKYQTSPLNPAKVGYPLKWRRFSSVAGYLPWTDTQDFPILSVYDFNNVKMRDSKVHLKTAKFPDLEKCADGMAIMYNFSWLNSLASYHGFTPYDELTYPFTTQSIVTDGKTWNFYVYQLNSHSFHGDLQHDGLSNGLYNLCWSSGPMKLFEDVSNNVVNGVNEKVIELLLKFVMREPQPVPESIQLRPYLGEDTRSPEDAEKGRALLLRSFRQLHPFQWTYHITRMRPRPWDFPYGHRNPEAPSIIHWRVPPRDRQMFRLDTHKFTV